MTQRSDTVARQLAPQDGLFTVEERGSGAAPLRVVSSVVEAISGRDQPEAVVDRIAAESTQIVTLTITEKGYGIDPHTGSLNLGDEQVRSDLAGNPPLTAVGQITRGIQKRARTGGRPLSVVSCDNLPGNGELTETLVRAFAAALPEEEAGPLLAWLEENVTFPSTMVDRMVPATTAGDRDAVERELGLRDEAAVVAEEALLAISLPAGLDGEAYRARVIERFANPALGHTTANMGSDGSQKIGLRLLSTVRANLDAGRETRWAALAVAAWPHHRCRNSPAGAERPARGGPARCPAR